MSASQNTATVRAHGGRVTLTLSGPNGATAAIFSPEGAEEVAGHLADAAAAARLQRAAQEGPDGTN